MNAAPLPARGLRGWIAELRTFGWIYPVVGLLLTGALSRPEQLGWSRLLMFELISCAIGLVISLVYGWFGNAAIARLTGVEDPDLREAGLGRAIAAALVHLLLLGLGVGLGGELALLSSSLLTDGVTAGLRPVIWRIGGAVGLAVMLASLVYDRLRAHVRAVELRAERARRAQLRAQLAAAQARTHPHFLFNSLNTVANLVEEDPAAAVEAIERLSDLLRYSLEGERERSVTLRRELEIIADYVALERLRFGARLRFEAEVDDEVLGLPIPPFVLQPAVENAVKHGVAGSREGATIRLRARRRGDELELSVDDDGAGRSPGTRGTGTGERDLRTRLELLYGARARLICGPRPDGGYRVELGLDPRGPEVPA